MPDFRSTLNAFVDAARKRNAPTIAKGHSTHAAPKLTSVVDSAPTGTEDVVMFAPGADVIELKAEHTEYYGAKVGATPQNPVLRDQSDDVRLEIEGQGTVGFEIGRFSDEAKPKYYDLELCGDSAVIFRVRIFDEMVEIRGESNEKRTVLGPPTDTHLIDFKSSSLWIWVSVDRANGRIRVGHGYMMRKNVLCCFTVAPKQNHSGHHDKRRDEQETSSAHNIVWDVKRVRISPGNDPPNAVHVISRPKCSNMPVVEDAPAVVCSHERMTLDHIAYNSAIVSAALIEEAQVLYGTVGGPMIRLSEDDAAAINYSLDTEGMTLNKKIEEKRKDDEFGEPQMVYIRVTIGPNEGDSPGVPFVLEIWPKGCYSPVHNHAYTAAVIKVLHGTITVSWYNPLAEKDNDPKQRPFGEVSCNAGDVTWLSPEMYQTHQLHNRRSDTMCATIQSYRYLNDDLKHYEFFDYMNPQKPQELGHFLPNSDFEYLEMLAIVRAEWNARPQ